MAAEPPQQIGSIQEAIDWIDAVDSHDLEGRERLGADLAWEEADDFLRRLKAVGERLVNSDPALMSRRARSGIIEEYAQLMTQLWQLLNLRTSERDPKGSRDNYTRQLEDRLDQLLTLSAPYTIPKRADADAAREDLSQLEKRIVEIQSTLEQLESLSEAGRDVTAASGASELATDYERQAEKHEEDWNTWGRWFLASVALAIVGSVGTIWLTHTDADVKTTQEVGRVLIDLLVVGLLLYLVRMTSLQFRVHRHLESVARNKAAALSTFNRIVSSGSEPEVRTAIAVVLAEAVFASGDSGFIDAGGDHITLVEKAASAAAQRLR